MPIDRIALGGPGETSNPAALRAALAEFISMLIYVFAGQGSALAFNKITYVGSMRVSGLIATAIGHAYALSVAVSIAANISGGHVNPAVTFGAFIGGNITLLRAVMYWIAQLLGSAVACVLLRSATNGMDVVAFSISDDVSTKNALLFELVMTFGLVYTVYATAIDPKKGGVRVAAPTAIGFIVGANMLVGGAFIGSAAMNPALAFGPAIVGWDWANHWVHWLGPMLGAALAALVYDTFFVTEAGRDRLPTVDY